MANEVKIIIGANYGDEGKGLVSSQFAKEATWLGYNPITILHNGTAQRGHTVDYTEDKRHVYHHFGAGTGNGTPTYFANTFLLHPMEFRREWNELAYKGITPKVYCDPDCYVITPFDMLIDHITEDYIEYLKGEREHGSCGFGSWCFTDRAPNAAYTISDFSKINTVPVLMREVWKACSIQLVLRGVDIDKVPHWIEYFDENSERYKNAVYHFMSDLEFFISHVSFISFNDMWKQFNYNIFENGQGLGLDQNCGKEWHTTSNTGLTNPINLLGEKDFSAEVLYVSRAYLTRHGIGDLEGEVCKAEINANMLDKTNVPNPFQGSLRYGFDAQNEMKERIKKDYKPVLFDLRYTPQLVLTHCNELNKSEYLNTLADAKYISNSKFTIEENK